MISGGAKLSLAMMCVRTASKARKKKRSQNRGPGKDVKYGEADFQYSNRDQCGLRYARVHQASHYFGNMRQLGNTTRQEYEPDQPSQNARRPQV